MAAIKREKKLCLFASDLDDPEAEVRDVADDLFEMTDFVFVHEWVPSVLEILMRREDLSSRDVALLLIAVRERYKKCGDRWNKIAYELTKADPHTQSRAG
jgi:hypothetical protein